MSIATRKAGTMIVCPRCSNDIQVPEIQPEPDGQSSVQTGATPSEAVQAGRVQTGDVFTETAQAERAHSETEQDGSAASESVSEETVPESDLDERSGDSGSFQLAPLCEDADEEELDFELKRTESDFEELDMTPMVDVTFLLLIFFMVTASFSIQKSIEVPPPDPDKQGAAQTVQPLEELEEDSILIEIDEENRFFVESEPVDDPRDLPTILAEVRSKDSKNEVVVSVDERTHHEAIVTAIDAAQEVGMQRIRWGVNSSE